MDENLKGWADAEEILIRIQYGMNALEVAQAAATNADVMGEVLAGGIFYISETLNSDIAKLDELIDREKERLRQLK